MRAPDDMPRRSRRARPRSGRGRTWLVVGAVLLFFLITSLRGIASFYTDYLWYDSLGQAAIWRGVLGAKIALAAIFTVAFFVIMWINLVIADRLAPPFRPAGPEDEVIERYHELVGGRVGVVRASVSGLLALIAGAGVSSEWNSWILFTHAKDFGIDDPQFDTDIGFYVFRLPFLTFLVGWLFAAILIVLIVTTVAHYLNGGIRMSSARNRVTPQVKAHLSVLLGLLALVKAVGYWLQRYELTASTRGFVDGAGYTDVNAQLPAINLLLLIMVASFLLFIINIWRRGWTLPILGVGLWALIAVVAGAIYPQFVQRVQVEPNEPEREEPYIARNIEATTAAMGLGDVEVTPFELETDPEAIDLAGNADTIRNIRVWDPSQNVLGRTFPQLQRIRDYYAINEVDVDRYPLNGELTQVVLSVRDLYKDGIPRKSWAAQHLTYTHGYGAIVAPANEARSSGEPAFVAEDIPYQATADELELTQPAVYFGEDLSGYVAVGSKQRELNFEDEDETRYTTYEGEDGVALDNIIKKAAFALRFGDVNPLISDQLTASSRILYIRDIRERVQALAPFLDLDADPYPVLHEGRIVWILDAYTTTSRYPYAQRVETGQLPPDSGLDHTFNYVRNSVKAVVDAYDGTVDFYVMPVEDPIIEAYRDAFPRLFKDLDDMPDDLRAHLRYPEDLFRLQTNSWAKYHVTEASSFYQGNDFWDVALDPGSGTVRAPQADGGASSTTTTTQPDAAPSSREGRIEPYYLFTKLPGAPAPEFVLLRPFVPVRANDDSQLMTAFMVAKSDGDRYGQLEVFTMPRSNLPNGPALVQGEIQSNDEVSSQESLNGRAGSRVTYGSLAAIPIDNGLVWVRPFYVTSTQTDLPSLRFVIVNYQGAVSIEPTLIEALAEVFDEDVPDEERPPPDPGGEPEEPEGSIEERVAALLAEASDLFDQADQALRDGNLGEYEELSDEARALVEDAEALIAASVGEQPATTTTTEPASA
jgi:uncharacterized membrane protein (UPF0182 family)